MKGRVLAVGGSDPSGGAGIQADLKTCTALGAYGSAALTAITVQNTQGVSEIEPLAPGLVARQITAVIEDIGADCIKIGMVPSAGVVEAIAGVIGALARNVPIVVDPVLVASTGATLAGEEAAKAIKEQLIPKATLVTPNLSEALALTGMACATVADMEAAAAALVAKGAGAALVTGGHLEVDELTDVLMHDGRVTHLTARRINTVHTHGTGCTLASAVATGLAQGMDMEQAVSRAHAYVQQAIAAAPKLGRGHGPINHLP